MPTKIEKDAISGQDTTGHEWDGIKELNTPLPKWWLYTFYACIAWSAVWFVLYPAWPTLSTHTTGLMGYSTRAEAGKQIAAQVASRAPFVDRVRAASLDQIRKDPELLNYALSGGRAVFADNCAPCHGPGGGGSKGFPNLADDDWLWGGDLAAVHRTIGFGVRNANTESRQSQMPRFGADKLLTPAQIDDVAEYVLSLSGPSQNSQAAARGTAVFAENCVACHGEKGSGNPELGAPNLADKIWLFGGDKASIVQSIAAPRNGSMPAWSERLDDALVKMLAVYVHSLGGGR